MLLTAHIEPLNISSVLYLSLKTGKKEKSKEKRFRKKLTKNRNSAKIIDLTDE